MDPHRVYRKLLREFGKQDWWIPAYADTRLEVIVGANLAQRTRWKNVEKAIGNLKGKNLLDINSLASTDPELIGSLIRPSGFYKQKAERITNLCRYLIKEHDGSLNSFFSKPNEEIRVELLKLSGIGPETADVILLYAGDKLVLPISTYTRRILERLGVKKSNYGEYQKYLMDRLPKELKIYKEFHALLVELGKACCKKGKPGCSSCPLKSECNFHFYKSNSVN